MELDKTMKKAKKSLLVVTSLGMVTGGYVHELNNLKVVHAAKNHEGVCQVETKNGEVTFNVNAATVETTKPIDLYVVMDGSPSMSGWFSFWAMQALIQSLNDDSTITFAQYSLNLTSSYGGDKVSRQMTKAEALGMLKYYDTLYASNPYRAPEGSSLMYAIEQAGLKGTSKDNGAFEDYFAPLARPGYIQSVIQFTDEWADSEDMDTTFADWAKKNAKTFMTVVRGAEGSHSVDAMRRVGHPNIYTADKRYGGTREENQDMIDDIVKQFQNTATERMQPTARINVNAPQGVTLKEVKLVSPDGKEETLPITSNQVDVEKELPKDGNYKVKVKADGLVHENRKVVTTVNVGGKEVGKNEILFEGCNDDVKGKDEERTKVNIDFKTNYIEDKDLPFGTEKVIKDGVIGIKEIIKTWNTVNGKRVGEPKIVENMLQGVIDKVIARGIQKPRDFTYRVLDKNGKVLVDTTKVSQGYVGNAYKLAEVPKLEGYEVETPEGVKLDGVFKGENVNIDFVAYKLGKGVTLKTVTKDGKNLQAEQVLIEDNKRVGTEYTGKVAYEIKDKGRLYRLVALEQDSKPVDNKPVENKPVENKPVEGNPVEGNPVDGKPVDNKTVDSKFDKDVDLKGSVSDVKIEYKAIYEEVKVGDVKVEFVDDTGKVLKSPVLLNTKDSLLGTDYKYDKDARLTVGSDTYALVKTTLEDKEVKDIKGKFDEKAKTYKLVYKKVVKPEPKKLPKTSGDNSGSLGLISTIVGLGVLLLGFVRKLVLK